MGYYSLSKSHKYKFVGVYLFFVSSIEAKKRIKAEEPNETVYQMIWLSSHTLLEIDLFYNILKKPPFDNKIRMKLLPPTTASLLSRQIQQ